MKTKKLIILILGLFVLTSCQTNQTINQINRELQPLILKRNEMIESLNTVIDDLNQINKTINKKTELNLEEQLNLFNEHLNEFDINSFKVGLANFKAIDFTDLKEGLTEVKAIDSLLDEYVTQAEAFQTHTISYYTLLNSLNDLLKTERPSMLDYENLLSQLNEKQTQLSDIYAKINTNRENLSDALHQYQRTTQGESK